MLVNNGKSQSWWGCRDRVVNNGNMPLVTHDGVTKTGWLMMIKDRWSHDDIVQWMESQILNPKTLGSILWRVRVRDSFSVPPSQLLYRLVCAWPHFMCTTHTQICVHIKDPISICCTRVGLTAGGTKTQKRVLTEKKSKKVWVAPYYGCRRFPQGKQLEFPVHALGQKKYLIYSKTGNDGIRTMVIHDGVAHTGWSMMVSCCWSLTTGLGNID